MRYVCMLCCTLNAFTSPLNRRGSSWGTNVTRGALYTHVRQPVPALGGFVSSSPWLSWLMNRNDTKTIPAPTQYRKLENCWYCIISPTRERGMVSDRPTVTNKGVVRSMA